MGRRHRVVQRFRFLVEGQLRPLEHPHARPRRLELRLEVSRRSTMARRVRSVSGEDRDLGDQPIRSHADVASGIFCCPASVFHSGGP